MVTVKVLKPYCVKTDVENIHILLEEDHFSLSIKNELYHFIPDKSKEIVINRWTKKIENLDAKFAFKKENEVCYLTMNELINIPDFLIKLYFVTKPYFDYKNAENVNDNIDVIIDELEHLNVKRLIDKALDERNEEAFYDLITML